MEAAGKKGFELIGKPKVIPPVFAILEKLEAEKAKAEAKKFFHEHIAFIHVG